MEFDMPDHFGIIVSALYLAHYGVAPDFQSWDRYSKVLTDLLEEHGGQPGGITTAVKALSEIMFDDTGGNDDDFSVPDEWFVRFLYDRLLGRQADDVGLSYWVNELATGQATRGELVVIMLAAALEYERDGEYVQNRAQVASAYADWQNSGPNVQPWADYDGLTIMAGVNEDPGSVTAALNRMPASAERTGKLFSLTPQADTIIGTDGDDLINAYWILPDGAEASTFTAGDNIDGGAGYDTLSVYADANGEYNSAKPTDLSVRNVERVNLYNLGEGHNQLADASVYEGLQELWQVGKVSRVLNLPDGVVAGFQNVSEGADLEIEVDETADSVSIAFDNVSNLVTPIVRADDSAVSVFTFNIEGSTYPEEPYPDRSVWASLFVHDATDGLVLNSAVDLELLTYRASDDDYAPLSTIDASGSSGDLALVAVAATRSITLGSGDDSLFLTEGRAPRPDDNYDGGAGFDEDIYTGSTFSAEDYAGFRNLKNFEQLVLTDHFTVVAAAEISNFTHLHLHAASIWVDPQDGWYFDATVHNLAADQQLNVTMVGDYEHPIGRITLVNPDDRITLTTDAISEKDAGFFLIIQADDSVEAREELIFRGEASMSYDNLTGRYQVINAMQLEDGLDLSFWGSVPVAVPESGMAADVRETVWLSPGSDQITLGVSFETAQLSSSTLGLMDVLHHFTSSPESSLPRDYLLGVDRAEQLELGDDVETLEQAFEYAAEQYERGVDDEINVLFFHFEEDTYLYADTWTENGYGRVDANDFALKLTGVHDMSDVVNLDWFSA